MACFFASINAHTIHKRGLAEFGRMILAVTGKFPTNFNNYGNHCGFGGHGTSVDPLDECCKAHDECYGKAGKAKCLVSESVYAIPYSWKYSDGVIHCNKDGIISSLLLRNGCAQAACECDRAAVECFLQKHRYFNGVNKSILPPAITGLLVQS